MISKEINNNLIHETNLAYLELRTNSKGGIRERERGGKREREGGTARQWSDR